jgi:hypothetical protein
VHSNRLTRTLFAFLCIALLLVCTAFSPSAAHLDLAIPALVFCFFAVFRQTWLHVPAENRTVQPISFLSLHTSRAPPQM